MSDDDAVMVDSAQAMTGAAESKQAQASDGVATAATDSSSSCSTEPAPSSEAGAAAADDAVRAESKQGAQATPKLVQRSATLPDDAWVDESEPARLLRPVGAAATNATPAKAAAAAAAPPAAAAAVSTTASGKGGKRAGVGGVAELLGRVMSKLHLVVDAIDKVQALVLLHVVVVQAYVAMVLLLFGSYFLQTIRCYEAISRLGFLDEFSRLYGRLKAVADANKADAGAGKNNISKGHGNKASGVWLQLRPHVGEMARTTFLCATCCLGILLSYLCGSLMIGASIGSRLDGYLDEFELR
jgi:hypothetical protein